MCRFIHLNPSICQLYYDVYITLLYDFPFIPLIPKNYYPRPDQHNKSPLHTGKAIEVEINTFNDINLYTKGDEQKYLRISKQCVIPME